MHGKAERERGMTNLSEGLAENDLVSLLDEVPERERIVRAVSGREACANPASP